MIKNPAHELCVDIRIPGFLWQQTINQQKQPKNTKNSLSLSASHVTFAFLVEDFSLVCFILVFDSASVSFFDFFCSNSNPILPSAFLTR